MNGLMLWFHDEALEARYQRERYHRMHPMPPLPLADRVKLPTRTCATQEVGYDAAMSRRWRPPPCGPCLDGAGEGGKHGRGLVSARR